MVKRFCFLFLLMLNVCVLFAQERIGTFYSIYFVDNTDRDLKESIETATTFYNKFYNTVNELQGKSINKVKDIRPKFNITNLEDELKNLHTKSNDVIVFYYIGHGKKDDSYASKRYPLLLIGNKEYSLRRIYDILKKKPHKLLIVATEACNNSKEFGENGEKDFGVYSPNSGENKLEYNVKHLFCDFDGDIVCSSSSPGQWSFYYEDEGCFSEAVKYVITSSKLTDWTSFYEKVEKTTHDFVAILGEEQTPQLLINTIGSGDGGYQRYSIRAIASSSLSASSFVNSLPHIGVMADFQLGDCFCGLYGKVVGNLNTNRYQYTIDTRETPFQPGGDIKVTSCSVTAGAFLNFRNVDWMHPYFGAGYGCHAEYMNDVYDQWAKINNRSFRGIGLDLGIIFDIGSRISCSLGATNLIPVASPTLKASWQFTDIQIGIGVSF